jgi:hypothetical protein
LTWLLNSSPAELQTPQDTFSRHGQVPPSIHRIGLPAYQHRVELCDGWHPSSTFISCGWKTVKVCTRNCGNGRAKCRTGFLRARTTRDLFVAVRIILRISRLPFDGTTGSHPLFIATDYLHTNTQSNFATGGIRVAHSYHVVGRRSKFVLATVETAEQNAEQVFYEFGQLGIFLRG